MGTVGDDEGLHLLRTGDRDRPLGRLGDPSLTPRRDRLLLSTSRLPPSVGLLAAVSSALTDLSRDARRRTEGEREGDDEGDGDCRLRLVVCFLGDEPEDASFLNFQEAIGPTRAVVARGRESDLRRDVVGDGEGLHRLRAGDRERPSEERLLDPWLTWRRDLLLLLLILLSTFRLPPFGCRDAICTVSPRPRDMFREERCRLSGEEGGDLCVCFLGLSRDGWSLLLRHEPRPRPFDATSGEESDRSRLADLLLLGLREGVGLLRCAGG